MSSGPDPTDCVAVAFQNGGWGQGVSKCADVSTVFSAEQTSARGYIEYCSRYTQLTSEYRANVLSTANRSCLDDNHVDTSVATAVRVVDTIVPCLTAYCEDSAACKTQNPFPCLQSSLVIDGNTLRVDAVDSCVDQICSSHPAPQLNQDIAGIGVIAAYTTQTGVALLIALSLLLMTIWPKIRKAPVAAKDEHPKLSADPQGDALKYQKLYKSLHQALVAYILAQNFLALAIAIASFQSLNSPGELGLLDEVALGTASGSVILPTTFGLYTLASFYRRSQSWYLFTLSLLSWVLGFSIALGPQMARLSAQNRSPSGSLLWAINAASPRVCENVAPFSICALDAPDLHPEYAFYYTLCLPVMLGLTIWQLFSLKPFSNYMNKIIPRGLRETWQGFLLLITHLGALGFFAAPCYFFFQSISDLLSGDVVNKTWGFGQIVAILATVPTVIEFIRAYVENKKSTHVGEVIPRFAVEEAPGQSYEQLQLNVRGLAV